MKKSKPDLNDVPLAKELRKLNSFRFQFFLSIVRGVGTVIGATIVVGILYALFANILKTAGIYPLVEEFFNR